MVRLFYIKVATLQAEISEIFAEVMGNGDEQGGAVQRLGLVLSRCHVHRSPWLALDVADRAGHTTPEICIGGGVRFLFVPTLPAFKPCPIRQPWTGVDERHHHAPGFAWSLGKGE